MILCIYYNIFYIYRGKKERINLFFFYLKSPFFLDCFFLSRCTFEEHIGERANFKTLFLTGFDCFMISSYFVNDIKDMISNKLFITIKKEPFGSFWLLLDKKTKTILLNLWKIDFSMSVRIYFLFKLFFILGSNSSIILGG